MISHHCFYVGFSNMHEHTDFYDLMIYYFLFGVLKLIKINIVEVLLKYNCTLMLLQSI